MSERKKRTVRKLLETLSEGDEYICIDTGRRMSVVGHGTSGAMFSRCAASRLVYVCAGRSLVDVEVDEPPLTLRDIGCGEPFRRVGDPGCGNTYVAMLPAGDGISRFCRVNGNTSVKALLFDTEVERVDGEVK